MTNVLALALFYERNSRPWTREKDWPDFVLAAVNFLFDETMNVSFETFGVSATPPVVLQAH